MLYLKKREPFRSVISDLFDDFATEIEKVNYGFPKFNTVEEDERFRIDVFYPGMKKENFKIQIDKNILKISSNLSEKKEEKNEKYHFKEFYEKEFSKNFSLPEEIQKNNIKASYEDGVLKVMITKDKKKIEESKYDVKIQ